MADKNASLRHLGRKNGISEGKSRSVKVLGQLTNIEPPLWENPDIIHDLFDQYQP